MPLTPPNLDDRAFEDLLVELRDVIPAHAPEWTNHNPSDPGITLIELLAYYTEALLYRVNRVTSANRKAFLRLLEGPDWRPASNADLDRATREAILRLRTTDRAVTCEDVERLVHAADVDVGRAVCVGNRDLASGNPSTKPGHLSVVVIPVEGGPSPSPTAALLRRLESYVEPRRLLGTRIHLVPPRYVPVSVRLAVIPRPGYEPNGLAHEVARCIAEYLHPLRGGRSGEGWPLGRDLPVSDLYRLVEGLPWVDHVKRRTEPDTARPEEELQVADSDAFRLERNEHGELIAVRLRPGELWEVRIEPSDVEVAVGGDLDP